MDDRELQYYKSRLDALTGELITKEYSVAQLTNESRQLQSGFKLLLAISSEFYKNPELNFLAALCCEKALQLLSLDGVIMLRKTANNQYEVFSMKGQEDLNQLKKNAIDFGRVKSWFGTSSSLLINGSSKNDGVESDICEWFGFPFCVATIVNTNNNAEYILFGGRKKESKLMRNLPLSEADVYIFESVISLFIELKGKLEFDNKIEEERNRSRKQLEEYNAKLETKVEERTREITEQKNIIAEEKNKSEALLLNILPIETAEELKLYGKSKPRRYEEATVLFTDFVDFSKVSEKVSADVLVNEIHFYFSAFDQIITKYNLEKIKTIGDSYMCASGIPVSTIDHAKSSVKAALEIADFVDKTRNERQNKGEIFFDIRIGLNSGPLVAGIVGIKKFAYDIWGDTVNLASRMESSGEKGRVNISGSTYKIIKDDFKCSYRGKIAAKGIGEVDMYFVDERI